MLQGGLGIFMFTEKRKSVWQQNEGKENMFGLATEVDKFRHV